MRNNKVGERVKQARRNRIPKMTQSELAIKLELYGWPIGRSGIAKIEMGLRQVNDLELIKLAKALSVSCSWLLCEDD